MTTEILDPVTDELLQLSRQAAPAQAAVPGTAALVLRRARRERVRNRIAAATSGVLVVGVLAASSLIGHSRYFDFVEPSEAMAPTIAVGDIVTIDKSATPQVGDVVLVKLNVDGQSLTALFRYAGDAAHPVPASSFKVGASRGHVAFTYSSGGAAESVTASPGHVLLLGDNAEIARDSRYFGAIAREDIIGVALQVRSAGEAPHAIPGTPAHSGTGNDMIDPPAEVPTTASITK